MYGGNLRAIHWLRAAGALAATLVLSSAAAAVGPGQAAPDFSEFDVAGQPLKLSELRGKWVVLEWTNPDCPFVQKHYNSANMQGLQKAFGSKGVAWVAINSTVESHPEFKTGAQMAAWMTRSGGAPHSVLIDADSSTGRLYGAKTTPHMFVIDPQGTLVYAGAIDDRRSANPADVKDAKNFVRAALDEAMSGKPVSVASTTPYGCSVKY